MTAAASSDTRWWPSQFGEGDQLGMLNHVDEAKRLEALRLVRAGRLYDLGHVLDEDIPVFPGRFFKQTLVTTAHHQNAPMPVGENDVNWITEQVPRRCSSARTSTRCQPPPDRRPRLQRRARLRAGADDGRSRSSASRPSLRS